MMWEESRLSQHLCPMVLRHMKWVESRCIMKWTEHQMRYPLHRGGGGRRGKRGTLVPPCPPPLCNVPLVPLPYAMSPLSPSPMQCPPCPPPLCNVPPCPPPLCNVPPCPPPLCNHRGGGQGGHCIGEGDKGGHCIGEGDKGGHCIGEEDMDNRYMYEYLCQEWIGRKGCAIHGA